MQNIRMVTTYAGPNGTCTPGSTVYVDDEEANDLVSGGYAEYVEKPVVIQEDPIESISHKGQGGGEK
jgi:hypothetical protein